jgi:hypothetical protein
MARTEDEHRRELPGQCLEAGSVKPVPHSPQIGRDNSNIKATGFPLIPA